MPEWFAEFTTQIVVNLRLVGIGLLIFVSAYISNMSFSIYYNIKVEGQKYDKRKLLASLLKIITFVVGVTTLVLSITAILPWATHSGLPIPEEYNNVVTIVATLGVCLTGCLKYMTEAFMKMKKILSDIDHEIEHKKTAKKKK